jgi:hypothetical protein
MAVASVKAGPIASDTCGIVMPISAIGDCDEAHWAEVLAIISDAITDAGLRPNLVSNADEVGIIQKRIIQNLYENPIVICDVSGKNPNVMFELGLRLAFDKPTIIIKDDGTDYSFDTAPIEHVDYPRDLRFSHIVSFKKRLTEKINATLAKSRSDSSYTTFLKHFGEFTVVDIGRKEISQQEFLAEELADIRRSMRSMDLMIRRGQSNKGVSGSRERGICLEGVTDEIALEITSFAEAHPSVNGATLHRIGDHYHLFPIYKNTSDSTVRNTRDEIRRVANEKRKSSI